MGSTTLELLTFAVVFAAICVGLTALTRKASSPATPTKERRSTLALVQQYSPAIDVMMEYRDVRAFRTLRRVRISQALRNRAGRLYLLGFYEAATKPRTFRLDRVICFASLDGEVLDTRRFVLERLGLPAETSGVGPARRLPSVGRGRAA